MLIPFDSTLTIFIIAVSYDFLTFHISTSTKALIEIDDWGCSLKKMRWRISQKITTKTPEMESFLCEVTGLQSMTLINRTPSLMISCEFWEILGSNNSLEHLWASASAFIKWVVLIQWRIRTQSNILTFWEDG